MFDVLNEKFGLTRIPHEEDQTLFFYFALFQSVILNSGIIYVKIY